MSELPVRIGICGDWLDHPVFNSYHPGCVVNVSVWPTMKDPRHGGLATSTSITAEKLWGNKIPDFPNRETLAKSLFAMENMPDMSKDSHHISGSQDAYGIVYPGVNRLYYDNGYLPEIESIVDEKHLAWLESVLYLVATHERDKFYRPILDRIKIRDNIRQIAKAGELCWKAIRKMDAKMLALSLNECRSAQNILIPNMYDVERLDWFPNDIMGWKYSGAGRGGYIVAVSERPFDKGIKINIRRN
jgi:galactokinase/mevalonate kinase-like predicted kinase